MEDQRDGQRQSLGAPEPGSAPADRHGAEGRQGVADEREELADERQSRADEREALADARERKANDRDAGFAERERKADERERHLDDAAQRLGIDAESRRRHAYEALQRSRDTLARSAERLERSEASLRRTDARVQLEQEEIDRAVADSEREQAQRPPDPVVLIARAAELRKRLTAAAASFAMAEGEIAKAYDELAAQQPAKSSEYRRTADQARAAAAKSRETARHFSGDK